MDDALAVDHGTLAHALVAGVVPYCSWWSSRPRTRSITARLPE
jgi:hypothetical protein